MYERVLLNNVVAMKVELKVEQVEKQQHVAKRLKLWDLLQSTCCSMHHLQQRDLSIKRIAFSLDNIVGIRLHYPTTNKTAVMVIELGSPLSEKKSGAFAVRRVMSAQQVELPDYICSQRRFEYLPPYWIVFSLTAGKPFYRFHITPFKQFQCHNWQRRRR